MPIMTKSAARSAKDGKLPGKKKAGVEHYTVAVDDLVITITGSRADGYVVACPFDPELVTQGRTLDEAVAMAKDARQTLREARAKPSRRKVSGSGT